MSKVVMHNVRASFINVFSPRGFNNQEAKYSIMLLIPKKHKELGQLTKAIIEAAQDKFPKANISNRLPGSLHNPLRDGDAKYEETGREEYKGCWYVNCTSKRAPQVYHRDKTPITAEDRVLYPGCFINVSLNTYGYDVSGNKGIALGLNGVQYHGKGEALGANTSVEDDFDVEEMSLDDDEDTPF